MSSEEDDLTSIIQADEAPMERSSKGVVIKHSDKDVLIKQYELLVNVHTKWLELILRYNTAYYLITGLMLSFCYGTEKAQGLNTKLSALSLFLPIAMGVGLALFAFRSAKRMGDVDKEFANIKESLNLLATPEAHFVQTMLKGSGVFFIIVVVGLLGLMIVSFVLF